MIKSINKTDIVERLRYRYAQSRFQMDDPIALHAYTKVRRPGWYAIGPLCATFDANGQPLSFGVSWFDVRLPSLESYLIVKRMVLESCAEVGLGYQNLDCYQEAP